MKKTLFILSCLLFTSVGIAQDKKIAISGATASSSELYFEAEYAVDGKAHTYWINSWNNGPATSWPVTFTITLEEVSHVDYVRYIPRKDAYQNEGNWNKVYIAYCPTTTGTNFRSICDYTLNESSNSSDMWLTENGVTCGQIRFTLERGGFYKVAASEIEAYAVDNERNDLYQQYFSDAIFSELKPEVSSSEGIEDETLKTLVNNLLTDANEYRKFRVGEYEAYLPTGTLQNRLKTSSCYNNYENPTGIYLKEGESCLVAVDGIDTNYPVKLTIKNWVTNENYTSYPLRNGLNYITASSEGNVFVNYYTDNFETAPNVKVHFINAPVQGYWDQATMNNEDWAELLKGRSANDNTILITRSEHAQLAYPISAWLKYCPTNVDSTMTLYQQVQWAQRDILGLKKYGRQVKNRQLFYATTYGFMAAGGEGSYCHVDHLKAIMVPDAKAFDFWGVGHEWGHNNQVTPGFKWSGCGETTNNIYASWGQIHFTGNPHYLRLEDEVSGVGEYANMRGGRMQTYFEEGLRKEVPWQLQDGPDYHGTTPTVNTLEGYDADGKSLGNVTTTSRNYDHFVKLVPFWQLNLWGTLAEKNPYIITKVIESIRSTKNYSSTYNTNGKQQVNWIKLACDSAKIDLLPFFEKAGMLRPINAYIEDYNAGWNVISEAMIDNLKAYVKEQGYPAFTEEINYINGHNYPIYRDCLKLEVPEEIGEGCSLNNNKVKVLHSAVKNAVAYETYNNKGELLRITMYGLDSDDQHSYTQVLYPKSSDPATTSAYIMAVGYDGKRIKIYEEGGLKEEFFALFEQAKKYVTRTDDTGKKIGFLKPEAMTEYAAFIEQMEDLVEQTDTRERPYGTWITELSEAIDALLNSCAPIIPNRTYSLSVSDNSNRYIAIDNNGLRTQVCTEEEILHSLQWRIVQADTVGLYYMQHLTTGRYISSAQNGLRVRTETFDVSEAVIFTLELVAPGEFYIQRADNPKVKLYVDGKTIGSGNKSDSNARWFVQLEEEQTIENWLAQPEISTNEEYIIYRLVCVDNGEYACIHPSVRYRGALSTGIYDDANDLSYWFYFKPGSEEGKYAIYNYKTKKPVTISNNNLYVNKDVEATDFAITLREGDMGLTIATEEGDWHLQTSGAEQIELSTDIHSTWKLLRMGAIDPSGLTPVYSSLSVRCSEGIVAISGVTPGCVVKVYDVQGRLKAEAIATGSTATLPTSLGKGEMAIVVVGQENIKVIIK